MTRTGSENFTFEGAVCALDNYYYTSGLFYGQLLLYKLVILWTIITIEVGYFMDNYYYTSWLFFKRLADSDSAEQ